MMIAGKVKTGDKILVEADKDGQAVFVVNGERLDKPAEPKSEPAEEKKTAKKK
jgi:hypothetical protein